MFITKLRKNSIYIPKRYLQKLRLKNGNSVMIKCSEAGIVICKPTVFEDIDSIFIKLDDELKSLFVKQKQKELNL